MGYNTTVFFLNDCWHTVREDPEGTIDFINEAMHDGGTDVHTYVTVMRTAHADDFRLYTTWQNQIMEIRVGDETVKKHLERPGGVDYLKTIVRMARNRLNAVEALLVDLE